jgi:large subunit ribosomal protein L36e
MARPGKAPKKAKKLTKGHAVTKLAKVAKPSYRKGRLSKRTALVRSVVREVTGFAPYERKVLELLQAGSTKDEKKALKLAKKRLGTHKRGLKKREFMRDVMQKLRHKS